jgi:hypothetical protein
MKVEKFDLEKVIHGAKVVTRDGREVLELSKFENIKDYPLVGVLDDGINSWTIDGYYQDQNEENDKDLFLVGKVQSIWVNVFKNKYGDLYMGKTDYESKEMAIRCKDNMDREQYIKTIEITDEV